MRCRDFDLVDDVQLEAAQVVLLERVASLTEELREAALVIARACIELQARRAERGSARGDQLLS